MSVLFCSLSRAEAALRWQHAISPLASGERGSTVSTMADFTELLPQARIMNDIVVIYIRTGDELARFRKLGNLVNDLFLIIICNSLIPELFSKCRLMYPRLLVRDDESADVIAAVIKKRLAQNNINSDQR